MIGLINLDEFHLVVESQFFGSPAGEQDLLARNIERPDGHSIVFCHVQGQGAPAAACFHDALPGLQLHLAAYVIQFRDLRLLQRCTGRRIISAGIDELRVEPEAVKIGIQIVVSLDIATRAAQRVALNIFHALGDEFDVPSVRKREFRSWMTMLATASASLGETSALFRSSSRTAG